MYGTMKIFADIPYHQAQISLYNNRIWCVLSYHYFETRFASFQPLSVAVDELATQYMKVVQSTINEDYPL